MAAFFAGISFTVAFLAGAFFTADFLGLPPLAALASTNSSAC